MTRIPDQTYSPRQQPMAAFERRIAAVIAFLCLALACSSVARAKDAERDDAQGLYAALREQAHTRLTIGGGDIDVVFDNGAAGLDRDVVLQWIRNGALAVTAYFGQYPVKHVGVLVIAEDGNRVFAGTTYGLSGSAIRLRVGRQADANVLRNDWVLTHEMTHLALPVVPRQSEWLLEGNATYVEPIARAQAGQLDAASVWRWTIEDMPKGLPKAGDRGLDNTPTWGRIYWGGAMFWLLADVRIQQDTRGRFGVQDALRAINRKSAGNTAHWSVDEVVATGDAATGTHVLTTLYAQMRAEPTEVDLNDLFAKLGVSEQNGVVALDDGAALADIRRRITAPREAEP